VPREGIDLLYLTAPESMCYISGYRSIWYEAQGPKGWPPLSGIAVHLDDDKFIHFDAPEHMDAIENETVATDARLFSSNSDNPADGSSK